MQANTLEWHEENYNNSKDYEMRLQQKLKDTISDILSEINKLSCSNDLRKFQIESAKKEGKKRYTDRYKLKSFPLFVKDKYTITYNTNTDFEIGGLDA